MKFQLNRKAAAVILLVAAVFLLVVNLFINQFDQQEETVVVQAELNTFQVDSLFLFSLNSFGLSNKWIKEVQNKKTDISYLIRLPIDLSVPVVLAEINSNFFKSNLFISSVEKDFSGRTRLTISSEDRIILSAEFKYDKEIFRTARTLGFIIKDFELSDSEDSLLLELPEPFSLLLKPSTENTKLVKYIVDLGKTYSILIDDDIAELKYRLNESYSEKRLTRSLKSIINDFSDAIFFLIDDNSEVFLSPSFEHIRSELEKRKINILRLSELQHLNYDDEIKIKDSFDNYLKGIGENESKLFLVTADGFRALLPEIERYRKTGIKFVHPSEIIIVRDTIDKD